MDAIPVVISSGAGHTADCEEQIRAEFAARGLAADLKVLGRDGDDLRQLVRGARDGGHRVVVVAGGDGSLHSAAGELAGSETALGILPLGTFNHFAKDLGVPLEVAAAADVIAAGEMRQVDVGEANGQVFVNNVSVGFYPSVVKRREGLRERLGKGKWTAFAEAVWRTLSRYRLLTARLLVDGREHVRRTPFVFIGNNRYDMDRLVIGRREALERGELSLYMARCDGPVGLLALALRGLTGRLRQAADFEAFTATTLEVDTPRSRELVSLDGEVVTMDMPLRCRIRPRALRVLAPAAKAIPAVPQVPHER